MKSILLILLLLTASLVIAQTPPGTGTAPGVATDEPAEPCVPAGETVDAVNGQQEALPNTVICDEELPESEPIDEPLAADPVDDIDPGLETLAEDEEIVEATADEVFRPGDEIHEDYPIPLPSDI
jgi:hypothetical protein